MHVAGASLELIARSKRGAGISYTCRHSRSSQSANHITGLISIRSCAILKCIYRVNVFVFMLLSVHAFKLSGSCKPEYTCIR